ncbi:MAG: rRNA pseudouridine synthase [Alphaproteobacteria bacterium]|jgi:23S rRNA pseudouridine2605 synthase|nr:rRNA pseudouridine synthase [Alphaproteobacteria bacterium]
MSNETNKGERIAKVIARAGLASRREAERWIEAGRVTLDGQTVDSPALNVSPDADIRIDGNPLPAREKARLWRYHKPRGRLTTNHDPEGRPTVFTDLPPELRNAKAVGRLDMNSEGLLLLTNDGELARRLELPSTGWVRQYRVRVHGRIDDRSLKRLAEGVTIEGTHFRPAAAELERQVGANAWVNITLREGKNREVRRLMEHLDYKVTRLIRTAYGPFQLGKLNRSEVSEIPARVIRDQVPRN